MMKKIAEKLDEILEYGGEAKEIAFIVIGGLSLLTSLADGRWHFWPFPFDAAWIAVILCGIPIMLEALIGIITEFDIKSDVLVAIAIVASVIIGETFAAGEVAFIMGLGEMLEHLTEEKARAGIENLAKMSPVKARLLKDGNEQEIKADEVKPGDILRVIPGEKIPADGTIIKGETAIDQSVMTGESMPVDKSVGDKVISGTINQYGAFEMQATSSGEESSMQRMIRLVRSADAGKARIVRLADKWATWIVVFAFTAAIITYFATGEAIRAVTVLVVFCPCALVLATPAAIMAAIGNAARHGFLVKEGDALERLSYISIMAFDKTGTLTQGRPEVSKIIPFEGQSEEYAYSIAAAAEALSEHPLGKAVHSGWKKQNSEAELPEAGNFRMIPGGGVSATIGGKSLLIGSARLMTAEGISMPDSESVAMKSVQDSISGGGTAVYVAENGAAIACIILGDKPRESAAATISGLKKHCIRPVLITGDNHSAAMSAASGMGISEIRAECLPEDKLSHIRQMQQDGSKACMIGDGVNDALALKASFASIAMGGIGSQIAMEAADISLTGDEIRELPHLIALSRRMMNTIRLNISCAMLLNFVAIGLAMAGLMGPVAGALVHNAGSVAVIFNSALLAAWKERQ